MPFIEPLADLFQRHPLTSWDDVHPSMGDQFFDLEGNVIRRGHPFNINSKRLPALLDDRQTVVGDLIPGTSWGSSLANMLTKASWDALRHPLIARNNNVCELCGTKHPTLDVHEIWSYDFPDEELPDPESDEVLFGTQRLDGLMAICKECHECFHLGLAIKNGRQQVVFQRLAYLNQWSMKEVEDYFDVIYERHLMLGKVHWILDLRSVAEHPDGGLTLKSSWARDEEVPALLVSETQWGTNITALVGVRWRHYKQEWQPVVTEESLAKALAS
jgi:hypothetical protein